MLSSTIYLVTGTVFVIDFGILLTLTTKEWKRFTDDQKMRFIALDLLVLIYCFSAFELTIEDVGLEIRHWLWFITSFFILGVAGFSYSKFSERR